MKLIHNGGAYKIVIPKALVEAMDWKKNDELVIKCVDKGLVIKKETK